MLKNETNLSILTAVFVVALVISNVIAAKVVQIGWIEIPAAVLAYPITFLMTDVISEIWGKKAAQRTVFIGLGVQLMSLALIFAAIYLPAAPYMAEFNEMFGATLGTTARFVIASLIAYLVSQSIDVTLFHLLKGKFEKHKWIRNNGSTMCSQLFDTAIFITIGFWGVVPNIWIMIVSQYIVKFCLALCDTPFFYLLTKKNKFKKETENESS